jgi:hypothetical protein
VGRTQKPQESGHGVDSGEQISFKAYQRCAWPEAFIAYRPTGSSFLDTQALQDENLLADDRRS